MQDKVLNKEIVRKMLLNDMEDVNLSQYLNGFWNKGLNAQFGYGLFY